MTEPQLVPFVLREHERDSLVVAVLQVPEPQVGVMTERLWVPVVSQVFEKPPHAP